MAPGWRAVRNKSEGRKGGLLGSWRGENTVKSFPYKGKPELNNDSNTHPMISAVEIDCKELLLIFNHIEENSNTFLFPKGRICKFKRLKSKRKTSHCDFSRNITGF